MIAISNSGPVIRFSWLNRLDILAMLFAQVVVPDAVVTEVLSLSTAPGAAAIEEALASGLLTHVPDPDGREIALVWPTLGRGEIAALSGARERSYGIVLLDDRRARQAAESLGPRFTGTVGLLVQARDRAIIPAAAPLLDALLPMGFRIDRAIVEHVRRIDGQ